MRHRTGYKQKLRTERTDIERDEINQWLSLRNLTEQEWMNRILELPSKVQASIARIVWWDFWSNRLVSERWTLFDDFLKFDEREETDPIPSSVLADHLKEIGYPQYRISLRLMAF